MDINGYVKVAPFLTHPLVLVGFGLFLVFSIHFAVVKLQKRSTHLVVVALLVGWSLAGVLAADDVFLRLHVRDTSG